jgi:hypothetical protein
VARAAIEVTGPWYGDIATSDLSCPATRIATQADRVVLPMPLGYTCLRSRSAASSALTTSHAMVWL